MAAYPEILIKLLNLTKQFGTFTAVSNVTLDIYKGEILGFLGPNGAGKSTTMKMMANLIEPTAGEVWIRGNGHLQKLTAANKDYLLDRIGFLIENPEFYPDVTPRQILTYFAKLRGYERSKIHARVEEIMKMIKMEEWIDKKIGEFSKGMRQKVGVVSAIAHDPDIIVLDEPHSGLDPKARKELRDFILKLKELGKTIFLSSHLLYEVSEIADRVAIIHHGQLIACDSIENLEMKAKRSVIKVELLDMFDGKINDVVNSISSTIKSITGLPETDSMSKYNPDSRLIEIVFNGDPKNQYEILKTLVAKGFQVTEFSVPKATLLEDIYLELVKDSKIADVPVAQSAMPPSALPQSAGGNGA
jgi:ABC-2 type transport system ATP-binding protein